MQPRSLGKSGLKVSPLTLGTMTFGVTTPPEEARAIAAYAIDHGVFAWDTADMYGAGASESLVGALLAGRRAQIVLSTKVFAPMGPGPNDRGLSARHLAVACEASLRRLRTDWIDLYYLHLPDGEVPIDETLRALEDLGRAGKVRYFGASNYRAWQVLDLVRTAERHGWQPISAIQPLYNLANRDAEVELLPAATHLGLGVVTYSPLARGILTGKYSFDADPPGDSRLARGDKRFLQAEWRRASVALAERVREVAAARGITPGQWVTAWAMANSQVSSVAVGPRTLAQAREAVQSADYPWGFEDEALADAMVPLGAHTGEGWPDGQYPITGRTSRRTV